MQVRSRIRLNLPRIRELTDAAVVALEKTAEAVHTEIVQAQVMPFETGNMQNESTFLDRSQSDKGLVKLVTSTPYVRRLYYHPEYHFQTHENPYAKGKWLEDWEPGGRRDGFAAEAFKEFYRREADV